MKNKKIMLYIIGFAVLIIGLVGVTFAFFNYTRTGTANTARTGRIAFDSSESGTFNLTNVFPITKQEALSDNSNSSEVIITLSGDTTYSQGLEYLITLEEVHTTVNNKRIPMGIIVTPEKTGELGTSNDNYFNQGVRGGSTSVYKSFIGESDVIEDGQYVFVGYIRPGVAEVNGTIGIRAFIDADKIAITDTPLENITWQQGRQVVSTEEWHSLKTTGLSFKVKVQSNEGIWVGEPLSRNDMKNIGNILSYANKPSITEINFIRMSEEMIDTHANVIDVTEENGEGVVKAWVDGSKLYVASPGETYFPVNSSGLLNSYSNLTKISFNNINTSEVENMSGMFSGDSSISFIDLSKFDTSNVTSMAYTFGGCSSLTNIDLSKIDTSNVENMNAMFSGCTSLVNIDLSKLNTSSVTNMGLMFSGCTNLVNVNISGLGSNNLTTLGGMYSGCTHLRNVNMKNFNFGTMTTVQDIFRNSTIETIDLSNPTSNSILSLGGLFSGCTNLVDVNISGFGSNNLVDTAGMFTNCSNLTKVNMSDFNFGQVESLYYLFNEKLKLEEVDLSNADMGNVTNMGSMFINNPKLEKVNLLSVDTSNVTDLSYMFSGCTSLKTVDLRDLDVENVETMVKMFNGCSNLTEIDLSMWSTDSITTMERMFVDCINLRKVNLSNLGSNNLTSMWDIFYGGLTKLEEVYMRNFNFGSTTSLGKSLFRYNLTSLKKVDMSNANTSNIDSFDEMFSGCTSLTDVNLTGINTSNVENMYSMFYNCTSLKTLDLSSFNTANVTNLYSMFYNNTNLKTIYVSNNWDMSGVSSSANSNMFNGCTSLVGGAGTVFDANNTDYTYAHIDGGPSNPGYLTLKVNS